jgi:hypothetical protein
MYENVKRCRKYAPIGRFIHQVFILCHEPHRTFPYAPAPTISGVLPPFARAQHLTDTAPVTPLNYKESSVGSSGPTAFWNLLIFSLLTTHRHAIQRLEARVPHQPAITGKGVTFTYFSNYIPFRHSTNEMPLQFFEDAFRKSLDILNENMHLDPTTYFKTNFRRLSNLQIKLQIDA